MDCCCIKRGDYITMKILTIFDDKGQCVLTLSNVNDRYFCSIQDIKDNQTIIAKDFETNEIVTVSENTSDYKKQQKINELVKKNEAYTNKIELEQVKKANEELNGDIKEELQKLKSSNIEIIDYINLITSEK